MRKMIRVLFLALLVIPILTITQVKANGPSNQHGSNESFLERVFHDVFGRPGYSGNHRSGPFSNSNPGSSGSSGSGGTRAPLDGGLSLLLAAGVGLGVKKAFKKKNPQQEGKDHQDESNELS